MEANQSPSEEKLHIEDSDDNKTKDYVGPKGESNSGASSVIDDEVLRFRIRKLIEEKPKPSTFQRIATNPLTSVITGFLLTGIIGSFLTHYYSVKQRESDRLREEQQREIAREKSFADEINKIRVLKIGEVGEKIYQYENAIEEEQSRLLSWFDDLKPISPLLSKAEIKKELETREKAAKEIMKPSQALMHDLRTTLNKNRFWLGEDNYFEILKYIESTEGYIAAFRPREHRFPISSRDEERLKDLKKSREDLRLNITGIRKKLLKEE